MCGSKVRDKEFVFFFTAGRRLNCLKIKPALKGFNPSTILQF